MSDPSTTMELLIGAGMPLIIAVINRCHWASQVKGIIALAVCVVTATVASILTDTLNWADWRSSVLAILGGALVSYHLWWRPSGIAPAIESATT